MALTPLTRLADLTVEALTALGGSATPARVTKWITDSGFTPTSEDLATDPDAERPIWESRVRAARRLLGDDGVVEQNGRRWELTTPLESESVVSHVELPEPTPPPLPLPQPTQFMPSVISPALTDPRVAPPRQEGGLESLAAEPEIPVIIELNLRLPGGTYWAYQQLMALFEQLHLVDGDRPMPAPFDEYVPAELTMSTIEQLVQTDMEGKEPGTQVIYRVWPNFEVSTKIDKSSRTIKADAAGRAFHARGAEITWAVIDSGIDATHPHFAAGDTLRNSAVADLHRDFTVSLDPKNAPIDSALIDEHPRGGHGTGVASIIAGYLAATYPQTDVDVTTQELVAADNPRPVNRIRVVPSADLAGMARETRLVSLKVITGESDSKVLTVMAALRYVMQINDTAQVPRIHGVNLSLGYPFDPAWFACGQSPLCQAVDRLVRSGVVVVVAAGNTGYASFGTTAGNRDGGLLMSINDPGNAERAITVGATHRTAPHTYGVSYFSSKGPTGDGRQKPDLVAPGERITVATTGPDDGSPRRATYSEVSGTSFAAPHVSGAAAAFLSVRPEFVGKPEDVKKILVESATPLGRERQFQGGGLLDLMRALQSV